MKFKKTRDVLRAARARPGKKVAPCTGKNTGKTVCPKLYFFHITLLALLPEKKSNVLII